MNTFVKKLCDTLAKEMTKEYDEWISGIQEKAPVEIVDAATEIFIKKQIIESVRDADYMNIRMLTALIFLENSLQECYDHWLEHKEVVSDISEIISDLAYIAVEIVTDDEEEM